MNQKILDVIERHEKFMLDRWGDNLLLTGGPGHIVYDDYNVEHEHIRFCLNEARTNPLSQYSVFSRNRYTPEEAQEIIDDTVRLLEEFLDIPYDECYIWEEGDN